MKSQPVLGLPSGPGWALPLQCQLPVSQYNECPLCQALPATAAQREKQILIPLAKVWGRAAGSRQGRNEEWGRVSCVEVAVSWESGGFSESEPHTLHAEGHWKAGESGGQLWQGKEGGDADREIWVGESALNLQYLREFTKLSIPFYVPEIFHNIFLSWGKIRIFFYNSKVGKISVRQLSQIP